MPPSDNCETQGAGTDGDAAAERMRSNGACSGDPSEPSPTTNVTFPIPSSRCALRVGGEGRETLDRHQFAQRRERIAVWYPEPVRSRDLLRPRQPERGRHLGDDVRLGDRLSLSDGEGLVLVGVVSKLLRDEEVPRHSSIADSTRSSRIPDDGSVPPPCAGGERSASPGPFPQARRAA